MFAASVMRGLVVKSSGKVFQHTTALNTVTSPCDPATVQSCSLLMAEAAEPGQRVSSTF